MARFSNFNRYTNGIITTTRNNQRFLVLRPSLNLEPGASDTFVTITEEYVNRPDLISFRVYGDRRLWWVIYEFNNIRDPFFDLGLGQILRIPARDRVIEAIGKLNKV